MAVKPVGAQGKGPGLVSADVRVEPVCALVSSVTLLLALGGCAAGSEAGAAREPGYPEAVAPQQAASPQQANSPEQGSTEQPAKAEGPPAPDFELSALDGSRVRLSDLRGQVVLLDFWATYCEPCLTAMPHLQGLYERHKAAGLVVVGISIDGPETAAQVRAEVGRLGVTFPIVLDEESEVVAEYNPKTSAPYSVLVGRGGGILSTTEGYTSAGAAQLDQSIEAALAR